MDSMNRGDEVSSLLPLSSSKRPREAAPSPTPTSTDARKIYVGGMPFYFDEEQVRGYWEYVAPVAEVDCMTFPDTGRFRGIAIITFATPEGASSALAYDGEPCEGKSTLAVRRYAGKGSDGAGKVGAHKKVRVGEELVKTAGYNVAYVGNMPFDTEEKDIRGLFAECDVDYVRMHTDQHTGNFKGFAHVHFVDDEGLDRAVRMNGSSFCGRELRVSYAKTKA